MAKINILDKSVYSRIAAGEVVERPFSVVKELVENSVDAGAREISIAVTDGGKESIVVTDDGCGISEEDLPKAFLPHATSKISAAEDLDTIMTLGFRGEAIASVASVAKVTILTCEEDAETGCMLTAEGGVLGELDYYPAKKGTVVTVKDLFYNTPARAKFMKSAKSEEADITGVVSRLILANPHIAFRYTSDGKQIYKTNGEGIEEAIIRIYGYDTIADCFKIDGTKNGIKVSGYIGKHFFTKPNRTYQTCILNGRYIVNATIQSAIHNAYSSYLMKRQYPFYVLNVQVSPDVVDVNAHPSKTDVRFSDNQVVYGTLYSLVSNVLDGSSQALDILKTNEFPDYNPEKKSLVPHGFDASISAAKEERGREKENEKYDFSKPLPKPYPPSKSFVYADYDDLQNAVSRREEICDVRARGETEKGEPSVDVFAENKKYIEQLEREKAEKERLEQQKMSENLPFRTVGQVLTTYLILERGEEIYFIDQHAAHERLLYDRFKASFQGNGSNAQQPMLIPYVLNVNPTEFDFLDGKLSYLRKMGFEIEYNDDSSYVVYQIPYLLCDIDLKAFFDDLLSDLGLRKVEIPELVNEKLMQKACKAAIKSGMTLSQSEIDSLLKEINGDMGLKCPHGRPIAVRISRAEIDKWFKRIV
ncbi:MAG: DNA mismatch repair endonuclease MutL [Candidatus Borkfalkiaceae bacterium]|nr:DNA mismatch repair endonuclease MutL [Christensenellaceae bacterium]